MADTADFVSVLNIALPQPNGPAGEGDDELRNIKRALQNTFPGDPEGDHTEETPDEYDAPVTVGPRYLSALPAVFAALDERITDIEELPGFELDGRPMPPGGIIMWSGSTESIPSGWYLCDGTNGTPDLRDRFIVGRGSTFASGPGAAVTVSGSAGAHNHSVTVSGTALTVAQLPDISSALEINMDASSQSDTHTELTRVTRGRPGGTTTWTTSPIRVTGMTGATHTHTATPVAADAHTHTVDPVPVHYALAFIMAAPLS
jgi:hypothetical protein